ncbi:MAG TPA: UxaA family hydrolase [Nitrospirota bacterium]|nr:UxaA family hydrolase [Nitrospirota bacterium]
MSKIQAIMMKSADNTATVLEIIEPNSDVLLDNAGKMISIHVIEKIPFGHKFATKDIAKGESIVKYGESIGIASQNIAAGQHVHIHNMESKRGRGDKT